MLGLTMPWRMMQSGRQAIVFVSQTISGLTKPLRATSGSSALRTVSGVTKSLRATSGLTRPLQE